MSNWRQLYFNEITCEGLVQNNGDGNLTINGTIKGYENRDVDIIYWAAAPATRGIGFTGSGLPYPNPDQAYDQTPNQGAARATGGQFSIKLKSPNAYYVGLGSLYVPPVLHVKVCGEDTVHHIPISSGIPFRTLTYPAPPSKNPRSNAMFYCTGDLPIRSQEQILRDSAYRSEVPMPDNFWGLRPAR